MERSRVVSNRWGASGNRLARAPTQHFATKGIGTKGMLSPEKDGDAYACMVRILFG